MGQSMKGHKYNGAIERLGIREGTKYIVDGGKGIIFQNDLFGPIPQEFYRADCIFVDPPWNTTNVKSFYTKADKQFDHSNDFAEFYNRVLAIIQELHDNGHVGACYLEMGKQFAPVFENRLAEIFGKVIWHDTYYYNHLPCVTLQAFDEGFEVELPSGLSDDKLMEEIVKLNPGRTFLDFCLGRGITSRSSYKHGNPFVGSELNINRMAVAVEDIIKLGGEVVDEETGINL